MASPEPSTDRTTDDDVAPDNLIALLGGEQVLHVLVERFYDLMNSSLATPPCVPPTARC